MDKNYLIGVFEITDLQKLEATYISKSDGLGEILKELMDKYKKNGAYYFPGLIYTSSYEDIFNEIEISLPFLFEENQDFLQELNSIKSNSKECKSWHDALVLLSMYIEKKGGKLFSAISPNGGTDYAFIATPSSNFYISLVLLHHFAETCNNASGWYDEFMETYKLPYPEFIRNAEQIKPIYEYQFKDDFFGPSFEGNARQINLTEEVYNAAIAAMYAAKKYC